MFTSGILHLIFLDFVSLQVTETVESEMWMRGDYFFRDKLMAMWIIKWDDGSRCGDRLRTYGNSCERNKDLKECSDSACGVEV